MCWRGHLAWALGVGKCVGVGTWRGHLAWVKYLAWTWRGPGVDVGVGVPTPASAPTLELAWGKNLMGKKKN
jgi:hypothetical protein